MTLVLAACSSDDSDSIVAASPTAISITTMRYTEPDDLAQAHCSKYGRKAVSRGGVKIGEPSIKTLWGYDCVDP